MGVPCYFYRHLWKLSLSELMIFPLLFSPFPSRKGGPVVWYSMIQVIVVLPGVGGKADGWKRRMNENCWGTLCCIYFIGNLHCLAEPYVKNYMGVVMVPAAWSTLLPKNIAVSLYPVSCLYCTFRCCCSGGTLPCSKCVAVSRRWWLWCRPENIWI